jgi:uncharacterized protein (TIGR02757 family)
MKKEDLALKERLDEALASLDEEAFIAADPVQFPRRYGRLQDKEIAAFLAATIAWGRRESIIRSAERLLALMGQSPYDFVMAGDYGGFGEGAIHRTFFGRDLVYYCRAFRACYTKRPSLEALFTDGVWTGFERLREEAALANGGAYSRHIAGPLSACKRLNMALRWLVRGAPVDMGVWRRLSPAMLAIPLDVHTVRAARSLGLLSRKSVDRKAAVELTERLRVFCPEDPVKYDLTLFSIDEGGE